MKKSMILLASALMMTACGFLQNSANSQGSQTKTTTTTSQNVNAAMGAGQSAGTALQALYKQYKADGNKFDYSNIGNIINTMALINNCQGLKENYKESAYLTEFGKGMVASSVGLITQENVQSVTNSLVDMLKNSETIKNYTDQAQVTLSNAAQYAQTASLYASSISTLLSAFAK